MGEALGDAIDEGLAPDQPHVRMMLRLPYEMLAGAEAHLEPSFLARRAE